MRIILKKKKKTHKIKIDILNILEKIIEKIKEVLCNKII